MTAKTNVSMGVKSALSVVASVAMLGALYVAPANALADTNLDGANEANTTAGTSSQLKTQAIKDDTSADAMPDNPNAALPNQVSADIPDDATVVSEDHAVTESGELKEITTGETVTDPEIVGTQNSQPDPLAKTDGESFIPVQADEVKQKVAANGGDVNAGAADAQSNSGVSNAQPEDSNNSSQPDQSNGKSDQSEQSGQHGQSNEPDSAEQPDSTDTSGSDGTADGATATNGTAKATAKGSVKLAALQNNQWGAHWGTYNGTPAFFDANNELFVQQAKGVIDVSSWQHTIDWQAVKNAGVEGAIIRLSYGWGNGFDAQALRNINECKRLGIPFGVYIYSYAYDANTGAAEGSDVVSLLRKAGVNPDDLSYPVYYDLEKWTWTGHTPPTNPSTYDSIVNAWYGKLKSAGYNNLSVYSYTSYLNSALNSNNIHSKTRWVAQYAATMGYAAFPTNDRGWQYTSSGSVNGISGTVDLNAFGVKKYDSSRDGVIGLSVRVNDVAEGDYFLGSALANRYVGVAGGSGEDRARMVIGAPTGSSDQLFHVTPVGNGVYTIIAKSSGKALDVEAGSTSNGTPIIQFGPNGGDNQKWCFYRNDAGYVYIVSASGEARNRVIDVTAASTAEGTRLELWTANGGSQQQFRLLQKVRLSGAQAVSSVYSGKYLDVNGASSGDGAGIDVWNSWGGANQRFLFEDKGNGLLAIKAMHSDKYLDIYGAYAGDAGRVIQYRWTGAANQLWYLQRDKNGRYAILSSLNNKAVDIEGMNKAAGASVITYRYRAQANQKWAIERSDPKRPVINWLRYGVESSDVVDGDYFLESALTGHYVSASSGVVIDRARDNNSQLYHVKKLSDGTYLLTSKSNGKALSVASSTMGNGTAVIWKTPNQSDRLQQWRMYKDSDALYYLTPAAAESWGKVLDVPAMSTKNGTKLDLWDVNGGANQRYRLLQKTDLGGVRTVSSDFARGNRLEVKSMSPYPDAEMDTWTPNKGGNQRFTFVSKGNGLYAVRVKHSGMVLDIRAMSNTDGAALIQYPWNGGRNQLWYLRSRDDGSYSILSAMNNKAVDIRGMQTVMGAQVITYRANGQDNQRWQIKKVS